MGTTAFEKYIEVPAEKKNYFKRASQNINQQMSFIWKKSHRNISGKFRAPDAFCIKIHSELEDDTIGRFYFFESKILLFLRIS